jgi:hypothetical protein
MLARRLVAVLLIVAVNQCPIIGALAAAGVGSSARASCSCGCCCQQDAEHSQKLPCGHDDQGDRGQGDRGKSSPSHWNCVCGGAIGLTLVRAIDVDHDALVVVLPLVRNEVACGGAVADVRSGRHWACHFPPLITGREVRALRSSLLV